MEQVDSYIRILEQLQEVVNTITKIEQNKALAAVKNEPALLDDQIRREQAEILKLKGLEQSRIRLGNDLGWEDRTFRQILSDSDPETKERLQPVFEQMEESIRFLNSARDTADRMIKVRLHEMEARTAQVGAGSHSTEWRI